MTKTAEKPNSPDAYDTYLADLISEIEERCAPLTVDRSNGAISFNLPPIPQIFESLDDEIVINIMWLVQTYFDYLKPLGVDEIRKRANALYVLAQDSTKNRGEDERDPRNVERNLTTTMLANRREALQENCYLHFYMLMLMRTGLLGTALKNANKGISPNIFMEIERAFERGKSERKEQQVALGVYELREIEVKEQFQKDGRTGGKANFKQNYEEAKIYALKRYEELSKEFLNQNKKRFKKDAAEIIHAELEQRCGGTINAECPDFRVLYEKWLPKKK